MNVYTSCSNKNKTKKMCVENLKSKLFKDCYVFEEFEMDRIALSNNAIVFFFYLRGNDTCDNRRLFPVEIKLKPDLVNKLFCIPIAYLPEGIIFFSKIRGGNKMIWGYYSELTNTLLLVRNFTNHLKFSEFQVILDEIENKIKTYKKPAQILIPTESGELLYSPEISVQLSEYNQMKSKLEFLETEVESINNREEEYYYDELYNKLRKAPMSSPMMILKVSDCRIAVFYPAKITIRKFLGKGIIFPYPDNLVKTISGYWVMFCRHFNTNIEKVGLVYEIPELSNPAVWKPIKMLHLKIDEYGYPKCCLGDFKEIYNYKIWEIDMPVINRLDKLFEMLNYDSPFGYMEDECLRDLDSYSRGIIKKLSELMKSNSDIIPIVNEYGGIMTYTAEESW